MAEHQKFNFRSLEDLKAKCEELNVYIPFLADTSVLRRPVQIGKFPIRLWCIHWNAVTDWTTVSRAISRSADTGDRLNAGPGSSGLKQRPLLTTAVLFQIS